jgi:hypothetical protein
MILIINVYDVYHSDICINNEYSDDMCVTLSTTDMTHINFIKRTLLSKSVLLISVLLDYNIHITF